MDFVLDLTDLTMCLADFTCVNGSIIQYVLRKVQFKKQYLCLFFFVDKKKKKYVHEATQFKLHLNDRCFYSCFWITAEMRCQKRLWILCFSKSEEAGLSSLSRPYFFANLLGNKKSWFFVCNWWILIRFVCLCVSRFFALFLKSTVSFLSSLD